MRTLNRRDLLILGAASALPGLADATVPPPPSSPNYLLFISNGVFLISPLVIVDLPPALGTCRNYNRIAVSEAVRANFTYTQRSGISLWNAITGAPMYRWWEVLDKRNGRILKLYELDRIEVRFADGSRVKAVYRGPNQVVQFDPLVGSERLPDGTRLYPRTRDGDGGGGQYKGRGGKEGGAVISVIPRVTTFSWSWSTQETPW